MVGPKPAGQGCGSLGTFSGRFGPLVGCFMLSSAVQWRPLPGAGIPKAGARYLPRTSPVFVWYARNRTQFRDPLADAESLLYGPTTTGTGRTHIATPGPSYALGMAGLCRKGGSRPTSWGLQTGNKPLQHLREAAGSHCGLWGATPFSMGSLAGDTGTGGG